MTTGTGTNASIQDAEQNYMPKLASHRRHVADRLRGELVDAKRHLQGYEQMLVIARSHMMTYEVGRLLESTCEWETEVADIEAKLEVLEARS